jgi:precorrin-6B methylase 2
MKNLISQIMLRIFPKFSLYLRVFRNLVMDETSYLYTTGWMRTSLEKKPVDRDGLEVPWMNYSVVSFLKGRLKKDYRLFEYGSGYSTLFFARLVRSVTSVEHDDGWVQKIRECIPGNVELIHKVNDVDGEYCRAILVTGQKYDVVIVDGRDRVNCIRQSLNALSAGGVIVLDDTHRENYRESFEHAKTKGFSALTIEGFKPKGVGAYKTTIFYRRDNCIGI